MLLMKEIKKTIVSVTFLLMAVLLLVAIISQDVLDFSDRKLEEPMPGQDYGVRQEEIPEMIMPAALKSLYGEFVANEYTTYPIGFYKKVKLSQSKRLKMAQILSDFSGIPLEEITASTDAEPLTSPGVISVDGNGFTQNSDGSFTINNAAGTGGLEIQGPSSDSNTLSLSIREGTTYETFKSLMKKADALLGGGSSYEELALGRFGFVPITYEEALEQYQLVKEYDKFTGGYARLFCDYANTIILSFLPAFLAIGMCMKDKLSRMSELIYSRKASSVKIILLRYAAIIISVMIPVLILFYYSNATVWGLYPEIELDYLAPLKYSFIWLLPSVMIATAMGMFLTELTNTPIAAAIQGLWYFVDLNTGFDTLERNYSLFRLSPRHNSGVSSRFRTQDYIDNFDNLVANRLLFAGLALLLLALTIIVYEMKRRGTLHGSNKIHRLLAAIPIIKDRYPA